MVLQTAEIQFCSNNQNGQHHFKYFKTRNYIQKKEHAAFWRIFRPVLHEA